MDFLNDDANYAESTLLLEESKLYLTEASEILDVPTITAYLRMTAPMPHIQYDQNKFAAIVAVALAAKAHHDKVRS